MKGKRLNDEKVGVSLKKSIRKFMFNGLLDEPEMFKISLKCSEFHQYQNDIKMSSKCHQNIIEMSAKCHQKVI